MPRKKARMQSFPCEGFALCYLSFMPKPKQTRLPVMEVCYKKNGVSTRCEGTDLDWAIVEFQKDHTRFTVRKGNDEVACFAVQDLVWCRVKHK